MAKASEYWRKRLVRDQALAQRSADAVAAEMKREYRLHYAQVVKRLDSLYVEAQRRGELSRTKLWNYLSYRDMEEKLSEMVEGGSMIQREKLTKTLNRVFEDVIGASADRFRREEYVLPYNPRAVIDTAWSGDSFSNRIWKNNERLAEEIRNGCRGIVMGLESPTTIKQRLMKDFDVTKSQAERLVDTETSYVFNKANLMKYQQSGRQKLTIVCLDVNTCDKCKALEGEVFLTMDAPVLPIHPRCHCAYCVPQELEDAEVTMSGGDLEAVYARKGVPGYGDVEGARTPKLYTPKAQRAAEMAQENGLIPASELQAKVDAAMKETLPELAVETPSVSAAETASSFGAPSLPTDVGIFGLPTKPEEMGDPVLTAGTDGGIMETEEIRRTFSNEKAIPEANETVITRGKLAGYLLNLDHKEGGPKAKLIKAVSGYTAAEWQQLGEEIQNGVQTTERTKTAESKYGRRYEVPIRIKGKKNKSMIYYTIWQVDKGSKTARFITSKFDVKTIKEEGK